MMSPKKEVSSWMQKSSRTITNFAPRFITNPQMPMPTYINVSGMSYNIIAHATPIMSKTTSHLDNSQESEEHAPTKRTSNFRALYQKKLLAREYPFKLINKAYEKALLLNREDLLQDKGPSEPKQNIILTTTFNPPNNHLPWSIKKYKFTL